MLNIKCIISLLLISLCQGKEIKPDEMLVVSAFPQSQTFSELESVQPNMHILQRI